MAIIGIDLGTTNSLVTVWKDGASELIPNAFGEVLTPSVVSIDENGGVYVGKIARERLISHPENTASVFKRFMGTDKVYHLAERDYTPQELSAYVLKKLKEDAEKYLQETVTEAVISVPAYFNNAQRDATKQAGVLAGFKVDRIINEPSAAALACQQLYPEEDVMEMVFDFGGGTLDVSVVDCFDNVINVVSVSGDNHLGGYDFDMAMAKYFCEKQKIDYRELSRNERAAIIKSAELCKQELSTAEHSDMVVNYNGEKKELTFDTEKMIEASAGIFQRMLKPIKQALIGGDVTMDDIRRIILVGGSCKMPSVRLYLQHFLKKEVVFLGSPDTIVALGAGTYAGIKERKAEIKDMLLTDVCPFTLGVDIVGGSLSPIIERNNALPVSRSGIYQTVSDGQEELHFHIYQGEAPVASHNVLLGEIKLPVPKGPKGAEKADIRFTYDINGILEVDAKVLSTDETAHLVIVDEKNHMSEQQVNEALSSMQVLKQHPRDKEENAYLISRCESLYELAGIQLREFLLHELEIFQYWLDRQDEMKIKKARNRFKTVLDLVEDKMKVFNMEDEFESFSAGWYKEAKKEELDLDMEDEWDEEELKDWFKEGHMTS